MWVCVCVCTLMLMCEWRIAFQRCTSQNSEKIELLNLQKTNFLFLFCLYQPAPVFLRKRTPLLFAMLYSHFYRKGKRLLFSAWILRGRITWFLLYNGYGKRSTKRGDAFKDLWRIESLWIICEKCKEKLPGSRVKQGKTKENLAAGFRKDYIWSP